MRVSLSMALSAGGDAGKGFVSTRTDRLLTLRDGRRLAWADFGNPHGMPVVYCHGFPSSRLEGEFADAAARVLGVRIIAPDRPGYGLSDFKPGRAIADWTADVAELADALGIGRFIFIGGSGGGPYAAACARQIPERLSAVGIVSGLAPAGGPGVTAGMKVFLRSGLRLCGCFPRLGRLLLRSGAPMICRRPEAFLMTLVVAAASPPDRVVLRNSRVRRTVAACYAEAFRAGARGPAWDLTLYSRPWGFRLEDISIPVRLWQGQQDRTVPVAMAEYQERMIPDCRATYFPNEGHFSIAVRRPHEILAALIAEKRRRDGPTGAS